MRAGRGGDGDPGKILGPPWNAPGEYGLFFPQPRHQRFRTDKAGTIQPAQAVPTGGIMGDKVQVRLAGHGGHVPLLLQERVCQGLHIAIGIGESAQHGYTGRAGPLIHLLHV